MNIALQHQISIALENQPGRLAAVSGCLAQAGIHIEALCVIDNVEQGMVRFMTSDPAAARGAVEQAGFPVVEAEVLVIETADRLGKLAVVATALAEAGINIEYGYASVDHEGGRSRLILKTAQARKALAVLQALPEY